MVNALGVHTFFGGAVLGVAKNKNVRMHGSMETWNHAKTWAPRVGVKMVPWGVPPRSDLVITNPACSRFSAMTFSKYSNSSRENVEEFEAVKESLEITRDSGAQMMWMENGPILFTRGESLLHQFNSILGWNQIYFLVLKISTMHAGLPQERPRTHVFAAQQPFPEIDLTSVQLPDNVGVFMRGWNSEYLFEPVQVRNDPNPVLFSSVQRNTAVFLSTRPKIVSVEDEYTPSVVSSRPFAWLEENRWFSVDEMAALMGYPPDFNYAEPGVSLSTALISKSVSPALTEYLTERVVVPYFEATNRDPHPMLKVNLT